MSIKVYLHHEPSEGNGPAKTTKLTVPKKWVAEKTVANVIELFTDNYNKTNPDFAIATNAVHLVNNSQEKIYSDAIVGTVLEDRYDYYIKEGEYLQPVEEDKKVETDTVFKLRCKNFGCNKFYTEEENSDTACKHHVAPPIFHDRIKGWTCCKDKKAYDWEEFQAIEGCTVGRHSTEATGQKIFADSPTVAACNQAELRNPSGPVLKSIDDYNKQNPDATTAASSAVKTINTRKSSRREDGTAKCQNKGCQKVFTVADNTVDACIYHKGQPVFHDAVKFWSCCSHKKCYDFDEFMAVPGCAKGYHDDGEVDLNSEA
jgi:hypothetical protein